jgi:hypothetical protein
MARPTFSGKIYLSFEQARMAMKATWINEWLDAGQTVLGKINGWDETPPVYMPIVEVIHPGADLMECRMQDGTIKHVYGYKKEAADTRAGQPAG